MQLTIPDAAQKTTTDQPNKHAEKFDALFKKLTVTQQQAVKTLHGPVLVIAGPGTGKTTLLTARLGYLLQTEDDQVQPQNILCLTYTDNAAAEMHHRLLELIGPVAHRIRICTFHAFCNDVIQQNPQYFGKQQLEPINDLERTQLMEQMLEELPVTHDFKRLKGSLDFDIRRLQNLFSFMKREDMRSEEMKARVNAYVESLPLLEQFQYKRAYKGFKAGDPKVNDIKEETRRMSELLAGVALFDVFNEKMRKLGRYDFDDMILWVIDGFKKYPELLDPYREQFQYIMVDEYQDTSGAQNEILQLLTQDDFDNNPNIFCVGDDDQSIYEFQGARIKNIVDFYTRYKDKINVFVMRENFRSTQAVLDCSGTAIKNNRLRLANEIPNVEKNLHAVLPERIDTDVEPQVLQFDTSEQEEAWVVAKIRGLIDSGVAPKEIAILYFKHRQIDSIQTFFAKAKIPYNVKKEVNVLDHPLVNQLVYILEYLYEDRKRPGHADGMLFEMLHYRTLGIDANDLISLAVYMAKQQETNKDLTWRQAICSRQHVAAMKLSNSKPLQRFAEKLNEWNLDVFNLPLRMLAEKVLNESNLLAHALRQTDSMEVITAINTFFLFLQEQTLRKPRMSMDDLNNIIQQMRAYNVPLRLMRPVSNRNGVTLSTCHGAKGSEYKYVFLVGCINKVWDDERGGPSGFKLPPTVVFSDESPREETNRRLFYVALTRAKEHLYVTYSRANPEGKTQDASKHVSETGLTPIPTACAEPDLMEYMKYRLLSLPPSVPVSHKQFVQDQVDRFVLSQSKLNTFLTCPIEFYFRCILRVPFGKPEGMIYGTAVHYALQRAFEEAGKHPQKQFPPVEQFMGWFRWCMEREKEQLDEDNYNKRLAFGEKHLPDYYNYHINPSNKNAWSTNALVEVIVDRVEVDGIPISGRIDKIQFDEDHGATIVDYKTDTYSRYIQEKMCEPNEKQQHGGHYWRQMVFYKILLDHHPVRTWNAKRAVFEFAEPDKRSGEFHTKPIELTDEAIQTVKEQIKRVYKRVKALDFFTGCGEEDCQWCNMVRDSGLSVNGELRVEN